MTIRSVTARTRGWARQVRKGLADDAGYSTETVIVTALLVIMGIAVIGIIAAKVLGKASGIDLG
ncbi:hypothetical protein H9Y04_36330 [Streptomyces sp. TRM66268-LWL]|uniref:Integral membrane protein n=1 Tax=Streptomyces polyasparticus TaxID=2767826 RepID=A0ABR7STM5_9ACTN|nr:hypothetical protein [Streptomyces polyasparticus]